MNQALQGPATIALAVLLAVGAAPAVAAGSVEVTFVGARDFSDAGRTPHDTEHTTSILADHLQRLGQTLPDGQTLHVDVLDVDLAGTLVTSPRGDLRVLRGSSDWPRIRLRYTLQQGGRILQQGEETLADLDYLGTPQHRVDGSLPYEERLLTRWFRRHFDTARAQSPA